MSISHYTVPIQASATICPDWPSLCSETATKWGHCTLDEKYGGCVIEGNNTIVLVFAAYLCTIIAEKDRSARTITFHHPAASGVSLANYTVAIPASARVVSTFPSLTAAGLERSHSAGVVGKYGGFVIEEEGVEIVFACDEGLSKAIEGWILSLSMLLSWRGRKGGRRGGSAL